MRRVWMAVGVGLALGAGACSSGHQAAAPPPTTTSLPYPDPYVVPAVITPAYVNAVFAVLNHVYGNATRVLVATREVTPAVKADLRAIFNDPLYASQVLEAQQSLTGAINNVRPSPGDEVTQVVKLIYASRSCIFLQATSNLSAVLLHPTPEPASEYFELSPKEYSTHQSDLNPTPWAISADAAYLIPTSSPNPCVS
jgi:hypothetical protein